MPDLYPEDQEKVDDFIASNVNSTEREPFKPFKLLAIIVAVLGALTLISYLVALSHGLV